MKERDSIFMLLIAYFGLIFFIAMIVWCASAKASQTVTFAGSYSLDNVGHDVDTAWLYTYYQGALTDSVVVSAADREYDGLYIHEITPSDDSMAGWAGFWVFLDGDGDYKVNTPALVTQVVGDTIQRDAAVAGDTAGIPASVYAELIDGSNEDEFKADTTGLARANQLDTAHTAIQAVRDSLQYCDTTGQAESIADQVYEEAPSTHNNANTVGAIVNALGGEQCLALNTDGNTTTQIVTDLTNTNDDFYNGLYLNCRSGDNAGRTVRITDYDAHSGDSGTVTVSPSLTTAASQNHLFVIMNSDKVDLAAISTDTTAADNLESFVDADTSTRCLLTAKRWYLRPDDGDDAIDIATSGNGIGILSIAYGSGDAANFTAVSGDAIQATSAGAYDINATLNLNDVVGDFGASEFENGFYKEVGDTVENHILSVFSDSLSSELDSIMIVTLAHLLQIKNDSLFTLLSKVDSVLDSAQSAGWNATDACADLGAYSCTVGVYDTLNDGYVQDIVVYVNNQSEDLANPATGYTDNSGSKIFNLSEGDWRASVSNNLFVSDYLDFSISGADSVTIDGYVKAVGSPAEASICSVYAWTKLPDGGVPTGGKVRFDLMAASDTLIDSNLVYLQTSGVADIASDGYWSIGITPNELLDTTSYYRVYFTWGDPDRTINRIFQVYVPDSTTVHWKDLVRNFNRRGKN